MIFLSLFFVDLSWSFMRYISSCIAHVVGDKKHILEVLGYLVSMISPFWDILGKSTFNEDKIESAKESLFTFIYKQRYDYISEQRSSFTWFWTKGMWVYGSWRSSNRSGGNWSDITLISVRRSISILSGFSSRPIYQVMGIGSCARKSSRAPKFSRFVGIT